MMNSDGVDKHESDHDNGNENANDDDGNDDNSELAYNGSTL